MNEQLYTFLLLAAVGAGLGFLFDCYRVTRNYLRLRWVATAFADLLYWLFAAVAVFLALLKGNWGEIRFYVFLALVSGAGIYFNFISVYVVALVGKTLKSIGKLLRIVKLIINFFLVRPVVLPVRWVSRHLMSAGKRLVRWLNPKDGNPPEQ
jgi:spore cortex biosynthesis protein YabQ